MKIETKYEIGQEVFLFNAVSQEIEKDEVYAVLYSPVPAKGEPINPMEPVSKSLEKGDVVLDYRYQLQHHQGLLEEKILFGSEDELKDFFLEFFKK